MKKRFFYLVLTVFCTASVGLSSKTLFAQKDPKPIIEVHLGSRNCVCKGTSCESSNFVSFRRKCGKEPCVNQIDLPGGPVSNPACS